MGGPNLLSAVKGCMAWAGKREEWSMITPRPRNVLGKE